MEREIVDSPSGACERTPTLVRVVPDGNGTKRVLVTQDGTSIHRDPATLDALIDALIEARTEVFGARERAEGQLDFDVAVECGIAKARVVELETALDDAKNQTAELEKIVGDTETRTALELDLAAALAEIESLKSDRDDAVRANRVARSENLGLELRLKAVRSERDRMARAVCSLVERLEAAE